MLKFITTFFFIFTFFTLLSANSIEDEAYNAYKLHNFKKALRLYTIDSKSKNLTSMLMVGLFLEKGLGTKQNIPLAIKVYKAIAKEIKFKKDNKDLNTIAIALNRLYILTNKKEYKKLASQVLEYQNRNKIKQTKAPQIATEHLNKNIDDYISVCQSASVVDSRYREGITEFDCELFTNFPDRMALFMKLRKARFKTIDKENKALQAKIDSKIKELIRPIIKYLQQDTINCYKDAVKSSDIKSCNYDYFVKSDPLVFKNRSQKLAQTFSNSEDVDYKLSVFEKERLINKLIRVMDSSMDQQYSYMVKLQ